MMRTADQLLLHLKMERDKNERYGYERERYIELDMDFVQMITMYRRYID